MLTQAGLRAVHHLRHRPLRRRRQPARRHARRVRPRPRPSSVLGLPGQFSDDRRRRRATASARRSWPTRVSAVLPAGHRGRHRRGAHRGAADQTREQLGFFNTFLLTSSPSSPSSWAASSSTTRSRSSSPSARREMALLRAIGASPAPGARRRCCSRRWSPGSSRRRSAWSAGIGRGHRAARACSSAFGSTSPPTALTVEPNAVIIPIVVGVAHHRGLRRSSRPGRPSKVPPVAAMRAGADRRVRPFGGAHDHRCC